MRCPFEVSVSIIFLNAVIFPTLNAAKTGGSVTTVLGGNEGAAATVLGGGGAGGSGGAAEDSSGAGTKEDQGPAKISWDSTKKGFKGIVCRASVGGENVMNKLGKFQIDWQEKLEKLDRQAVYFTINKLLLQSIEVLRDAYIALFDYAVDSHIVFDKFVINAIIKSYKILEDPINNAFKCI